MLDPSSTAAGGTDVNLPFSFASDDGAQVYLVVPRRDQSHQLRVDLGQPPSICLKDGTSWYRPPLMSPAEVALPGVDRSAVSAALFGGE
jgi:hypothetical protein